MKSVKEKVYNQLQKKVWYELWHRKVPNQICYNVADQVNNKISNQVLFQLREELK